MGVHAQQQQMGPNPTFTLPEWARTRPGKLQRSAFRPHRILVELPGTDSLAYTDYVGPTPDAHTHLGQQTQVARWQWVSTALQAVSPMESGTYDIAIQIAT